jgi:hypothetical protein
LLLRGSFEAARNRIYIISETMEMVRFVNLICQVLGCYTPRFRMSEGVARMASFVGGLLGNRFSLTQSTINALTKRAVYSSTMTNAERGSVPLGEGPPQCFVEKWRLHHGR